MNSHRFSLPVLREEAESATSYLAPGIKIV